MLTLAIEYDVSLKALHTFASDQVAACCVYLRAQEQIQPLLELLPTLPQPVRVLGGGSNVVFGSDFSGTLIINQLKGRTCLEPGGQQGIQRWRVAAGEVWHEWVQYCVFNGLCGLENLGLIPGTVGAAPIQNIGAYGVELADVCVGVSAIELTTGKSRYFSANDCQFGYRESFFKSAQARNQWLITAVDFELSETFVPRLSYPALKQRCANAVSAQAVFDAVCLIRKEKLPDPSVLPNAGSFFKNPVLSSQAAKVCLEKLPHVPIYPLENGDVKLSAAYLIESAGFKGQSCQDVGVYKKHALVLVRLAPGKGLSIINYAQHIQSTVKKLYQIDLEIEPQVWAR